MQSLRRAQVLVAGGTIVAGLVGCAVPPTVYQSNASISTVAGDGSDGYSGDGGPATKAEMYTPTCVATTSAGDMVIADSNNNVMRRITKTTQVMSTYAGNGVESYAGDGAAATNAELDTPTGCAVDASDNVYIADSYNHVIRKVNSTTGVITTIVGDGTNSGHPAGSFAGDGGPALQAEMSQPKSVAVAKNGDIYIADTGNNRIRKVTIATGIITTIGGNGVATTANAAYTGDGGPATSAPLDAPVGITLDGNSNVFFADSLHNAVRRIDAATGTITTVAGIAIQGYSGDGAAATKAALNTPQAVAFDSTGNLYIADSNNHVVRMVTAAGVISTIAGTGTYGYTGDGGTAAKATFEAPSGMTFDSAGNLYVLDRISDTLRKITF